MELAIYDGRSGWKPDIRRIVEALQT